MSALHEIIRDMGRNLATLLGDDFTEGLSKTLAEILPGFHVGRALVCDKARKCVGPTTVVATSPLEDGKIDADATAIVTFTCSVLDEATLSAGYECIAQVKALEKSPSEDPSRSTVTLGVIVAPTSEQSLEAIGQMMRRLNIDRPSSIRPDMVAVLDRGIVNYLVTFGPDQTMPGEWLPPALEKRDLSRLRFCTW